MAERHALITGCNGFVGRRLRTYLESQGWTAVGADAVANEEADIRAFDLSDWDSIQSTLEAAGDITHVFHLAAITFVPDSVASPAKTFEVNLNGTVGIAHTMREHCPEARLINIGSSECYGPPTTLPVDEAHPMNPQNPYAISKCAADQYCAHLSARGDLDIIRARPFNHSGPGQADRFVLSSFAKQAAEMAHGMRSPVMEVGNLAVARDFSHVDDVIRAYEAAALEGASGEAYNVCSGVASSLTQAIDILRDAAECDIETKVDESRYRKAEIPEVRGTHDKLTQATSWCPERDFETLMRELYAYWFDVLSKT